MNITDIINTRGKQFLQNIREEKYFFTSQGDLGIEMTSFGFLGFGFNGSTEYQYFYRALEHYARRFIVGIFYDLFNNSGNYKVEWPEIKYSNDPNKKIKSLKSGSYSIRHFTNKEIEDHYLFELIIDGANKSGKNKRIGVCFCDSFYNEKNYSSRNDIDEIWELNILNFEYFEDCFNDYDYICTLDNDKTKIFYISISNIFYNYFSKNDYEIFADLTSKYADKARDIVGVETIINLSPEYMVHFRDICKVHLRSAMYEADNGFEVIYKDKKPEVTSNLDTASQRLMQKYKFNVSMIEDNLIDALLTKTTFSKCFETSEYLYMNFNRNNCFDYTAIVSGYLKSIEQLLKVIVSYYKKANNEDDDSMELQMAALVYYLRCYPKRHKHCKNAFIFNVDSSTDASTIIKCLDCYRDECRNGFFHSDMLSEWDYVSKIRKNTMFIYALLIAGTKLPISKLKKLYEIRDDSLEMFYVNVVYDLLNRFNFRDKNGIVHNVRLSKYQNIEFDNNGFIKDGTGIVFIKNNPETSDLDLDSGIFTEKDMFVVDRNSIPESLSYTKEDVDFYTKWRNGQE